jgi:NAD-dependent deacetylase
MCNTRYERDAFDLQRMLQNNLLPPRCTQCGSAIKSDIVYFGEPIPEDVAQQSFAEAKKCDLMLICGTSAVVYPFAGLPRVAAGDSLGAGLFIHRQGAAATIIEINGEPTPLTRDGVSTYLIRGKIGEILPAVVDEVRKIGTAVASA